MISIFVMSCGLCAGVYNCYFGLLEQFLKPTATEVKWKGFYSIFGASMHQLIYIYAPMNMRWVTLAVLYLVPIACLFHGNISVKALLYIFHLLLIITFELIGVMLLQATGQKMLLFDLTMLQVLLTAFVWVCYFIIERFMRCIRSAFQGGLDHSVLLLIMGCAGMLGIIGLHICFSLDIMHQPGDPGNKNLLRIWLRSDSTGLFVSLLLLLGLPYLLLSVIHRMEARARASREAALSLRRAQYELLGYRDAIASEARMRRFRHDMRGHLAALLAMVRSGEHEREAAYIRELMQEIGRMAETNTQEVRKGDGEA